MRPRGACVAIVLFGALLAWKAWVPQVGQPAPEFELKTLAGGQASLSALRGQPILVNFWASWCGPCRDEMPEIILTYRKAHESGLEVVAFNLTDQERKNDIRRFVDELRLPFPVALDDRGKVRRRYGLIGVPSTVFVDSSGVVRAVHSGPMTRQSLDQDLATIILEPGG